MSDEYPGGQPPAEQAPPPAEAAPVSPEADAASRIDWAPFRHAGITPDRFNDPYELQQRYEFVEAMRDPARRDWAMTQALRTEHDLPEGIDYQYMRRAALEAWEREQQMFQPQGQGEVGGDDRYAQLAQYVQRLESQMQEQQVQAQQQALMNDLVSGVEQLSSQHNLTDVQKQVLGQIAVGQVQAGVPPHEAVQSAWGQLDQARSAWLQNAVQGAENVPQTSHRAGAPPATDQPPQSVNEALDRMFGPRNGYPQ